MNENSHHRFVAFFDLLGFSHFVEKNSVEVVLSLFRRVLKSILATWYNRFNRIAINRLTDKEFTDTFFPSWFDKMETIYEHVKDHTATDTKQVFDEIFEDLFPIRYIIMSDSIVLYSEPIKTEIMKFIGLRIMVDFSRELFSVFFKHNMFLRGALSYGEFYIDEKQSIYFGKAYQEAVQEEKRQEWIGCVLCDSFDQIVDEYFRKWRSFDKAVRSKTSWTSRITKHSIVNYPVPIKGNSREERRILNWSGSVFGGQEVSKNYFDNCITGHESIDLKYKNTLEYLTWWHSMLVDSLRTGDFF